MNYQELLDIFAQPSQIEQYEFEIIKSIAVYSSQPNKSTMFRDLVLRVLEHRARFTKTSDIIESLTRNAGLFPYLNQEKLDFKDSIAYEFHRPLNMEGTYVFHEKQNEIYHRLLSGESIILSAPTSFGKSLIIDAMIATEKFDNIMVVVPTLALIDETRRRLSKFSDRYKIITQLSQVSIKRNVFVFTQERVNAYDDLPNIDFFVIDEFYKINSLEGDNSRTVALNLAFQKLHEMGGQFYLLGPCIEKIPDEIPDKLGAKFIPTNYNTVISEQRRITKGKDDLDDLMNLCRELKDQTLIFCRSPKRVNDIAQLMLKNDIGIQTEELIHSINWASKHYHPDWIWGKALYHGIGIHHGRLPRSLSQYVVRMFNESKLQFLICTSTLIEGVNTNAKNVVVFDNTIANRKYDYFTFNNIKGRSGRMFVHYIGNVYLFNEPPQAELPFVDFPLITQDNRVPNSLLVQIDENELSPEAKTRTQDIFDSEVLPMKIIKSNATIDPDNQIELAEKIHNDIKTAHHLLNWSQKPTWDQLVYTCELIWKYLAKITGRFGGIGSSRQLAVKIIHLQRKIPMVDKVMEELKPGKYQAESVDVAVEKILQFERDWASFHFPRYLRALSQIQEYVVKQYRLPFGDYRYFASRVECLFRNHIISTFDEFGIPVEVAQKIQQILDTEEDIDIALSNFKKANFTGIELDPFEFELLEDAQRSIG